MGRVVEASDLFNRTRLPSARDVLLCALAAALLYVVLRSLVMGAYAIGYEQGRSFRVHDGDLKDVTPRQEPESHQREHTNGTESG